MPGERSLPISVRENSARVQAASGLCLVLLLQFLAVQVRAQAPAESDVHRPAGPLYDLIALRVEFQPDSSRFSTGDGTFDGRLFDVDEELQVDPLPHDAGYFGAHLSFLERYIERVSDGRTQVRTHLLPVVRVSGPMADYAPIGQESDSPEQLARLATLVEEAWTLAASQGIALPAGLSPETTAFAILHAGVGRDVDLLGTTLDKTPEDLPSIYFSEDALRLHLDSMPEIGGFDVSNTMIIPRTESRQGVHPITGEPFVLGLSINGLIAASFLNYLGVPDLFDTETGRSAIGPFGVMDALGIFAYNGLFPPEPSAWTKQYLGWAEVRDASEGTHVIPYSGDPQANQSVRASISDSEYFLVENRHRDPENDGVVLTVYRDGSVVTERFDNGDPEFNDQTIDGFGGGVVVDVDQYDFALPGGIDENDNPLVGGMLIWHIDENRLRAGLDDNAVNVGPEARSIDLEEADGPQDIGFPSRSDFGPQFELGTPFDFWFEGNPVSVVTQTGGTVRLYENRFGPDTTPSSASNAGGPSFLEISDIGPHGPVMAFRVSSTATPAVQPLRHRDLAFEMDFSAPGLLDVLDTGDPPQFYIKSGGWLLVYSDSFLHLPLLGRAEATLPLRESSDLIVAEGGGLIRRAPEGETEILDLANPGGEIDRFFGSIVRRGAGYEVPAVVDGIRTMITTRDISTDVPPGILARLYGEDVSGEPVEGYVMPRGAVLGDMTWSWPELAAAAEWPVAGDVHDPVYVMSARGESGLTIALTSPGDGRLLILTADETGVSRVEDIDFRRFADSRCNPTAPMQADLDSDGRPEIVAACGRQLFGFHRTGAGIAGFPLDVSGVVTTPPVVVRNADGAPSVLMVGTEEGYADAFVLSQDRRRAAGFPISIGTTTAVAPDVVDGTLVTASGSGSIHFYQFQDADAWASASGPFDDRSNRRFVHIEAGEPGGGDARDALLVKSETYNWPNPIRDGRTFIRFELTEPADVTVTIVDLAGALVDRLEERDAPAGVPVEIEWTTDAGSGVYLVRVEAASGGRSETRLIKMAVIR